MIRHIVTWKIKDFAEGQDRVANIKRMKTALESLPAQIPQIRQFQVGINSLFPDANDHIILVSEFDSAKDLQSYIDHPAHVAVAEFVSKIRATRACVDYEF